MNEMVYDDGTAKFALIKAISCHNEARAAETAGKKLIAKRYDAAAKNFYKIATVRRRRE